MSIPLEEAVDMAVRGIEANEATQSVKLGKHNFYVRPISHRTLLNPEETSYFRHQHIGKDDRVFYSIQVAGKGKYTAKITRVQFRGPLNFGRGMKVAGLDVTDALSAVPNVFARIAAAILKFLKNAKIQSALEGNWLEAAAKIVDAIGRRMAADAK